MKTYAGSGLAFCRGSGTSVKIAATKPRPDGRPHCMVVVRRDKPSGLCNFCERTERS